MIGGEWLPAPMPLSLPLRRDRQLELEAVLMGVGLGGDSRKLVSSGDVEEGRGRGGDDHWDVPIFLEGRDSLEPTNE